MRKYFPIIFVTGILTAFTSSPFVEAQTPSTLNGYQLNANQSKWVEYIAKEVAPLVGADVAARVTWWTLKEAVLNVSNPIAYSNCGDTASGNHYVDFLYDCKAQTWQVGIAAVQVNNHSSEAVRAKAGEFYPGVSERDLINKIATRAGYSLTAADYNKINSSEDLLRSILLRDPAIGFALVYGDIAPCLSDPRATWCQYDATNNIAANTAVTNQVIGELATYYKNSTSGTTPNPSPSPSSGGEQEVSLGPDQQIGKFYAWALGIGGLIALGVLIFAGILYTTSAGNASRQGDAKEWIIGAIVGLIILFGSWFILNTINPKLTKFTDLKLLANKGAQGLPGSGGGSVTGGAGFGGSIFTVNNLPIQVQIPACASYNFAPTSFSVSQASCPVYTLAPAFGYSDDFCQGRPAGTTGGSNVHHATDIIAQEGSPVYAFEGGEITTKGWNDCGGNRLWIRGKSGLSYYYAHLVRFAPSTNEGQEVQTGALIGFVGNTGCAAGGVHHLHFEIYPPGPVSYGINAINPKPILDQVCKAAPGGTPTESPGLAQVLNKSPYNEFGVLFAELGGQSVSGGTGKTFKIASLYKLFVARYLYEQRERGLSFSQKAVQLIDVAEQLAENGRDGNPSSVWSTTPKEGQYVSIQDCMSKMITWSDNVCGTALLKFVQDKGYAAPGGSSELAANDIAKILTDIAQGNMASPSASQELYNLLLQQHHTGKIPKGVPSSAVVANKTGELHGSNYSNDAAIIKYNGKTYILVVLTHLDPDTSSTNQTIQQLTRELFNALKK